MTETSQKSANPGVRFALLAAVLSVGFFGLLRVPWVETNVLLPFTGLQEQIACRIGGDPTSPVHVDLSCSGSDVIALCLGFIFAFPTTFRKRLFGAFVGLLVISSVNTVRIATLTHAIRNREWFDLLHVYLWPGVLLVVVAVYVFLWMSWAQGGGPKGSGLGARLLRSPVARRFLPLTVLFVALFVGTTSWWSRSEAIGTVAFWVAQTASGFLQLIGVESTIHNAMLRTPNGAFIVTQECIFSPLIPIYFAAALSLQLTPWRRALVLLAALPTFFLLGTGRLLVLALPVKMIGSHQVAVHAFYQMLAALAFVLGAALLGRTEAARGTGAIVRRTLLALAGGGAFALVFGPAYTRVLTRVVESLQGFIGHAGHTFDDGQQGALFILPAFQLSLFLALWLALAAPKGWRRLAGGLGLLIVTHPLVHLLLGECAAHLGYQLHVAAVRGWALLAPTALAWALFHRRPRRGSTPASLAMAGAGSSG